MDIKKINTANERKDFGRETSSKNQKRTEKARLPRKLPVVSFLRKIGNTTKNVVIYYFIFGFPL
jgi:hypothetical protein